MIHLKFSGALRGLVALAGVLAGSGKALALGLILVGSSDQWSRVEFRVTGVPVVGNPFDPDAIRVDATFRAPSGKQHRVPAFWHREYARTLTGATESLTAIGSPEWRVRHLPTEVGQHLVSVTVRLQNSADGETVASSFTVTAPAVAPARQGLARIAANRRYFETTDGQPLPLVGHCVCWHGGRGTFDYDDWFAAMATAGENYTRLWMAPWAFGIEAEAGTGLNYRLDRAWQLDYVLELAERRGIQVMLCFDYHGMFETEPDFWGANNNWKINPYNVANGGPCATQNEFFTKPAARALYQKRLRYLIARYGYSPNLLAWQFFNEIDNVYRYLQPADVAAWHAAMGDWLKANDPWGHLVTTSLTGSSDRSDIWKLPQMDFSMYHSYAQARPAGVLPGIANRFFTNYAKPVMIGEFGTDWRGWRREQDPFLRGWRQGVWAGALGGSVGTSMSWWWEDIHRSNLYETHRALRDILAPAGWGAGEWSPISFATDGDPPSTVGEAVPAGEPFSVTLPLDANWGSKVKGQLAVADPDASSQSAAVLNAFVHATAHPELKNPFRLDAWFTNAARLVLHLNSVSDGAVLAVYVDGRQVFRRSLPNKDGAWVVNNEYNEDIPVDLPAGRHLVEVRNLGGDWFNLDWVRMENVLPATYPNGWQVSPVAVGLRRDRAALVYVVNPRASFPANATNAVVEPLRSARLRLSGLPAGQYRAVWFDPKSAARLVETSARSDGTLLSLPLPEFGEDLAGRVEFVQDFTWRAPAIEENGRFAARLEAEPGRRYVVETSPDFTAWQSVTEVTGDGAGVLFEDSGELGPQRFYRARLGD